MRWSRYFLQTVREVPGDAEAVSHVLLTRAGMMRRVAAGIYSLTPLGLRAHRKTETIVREEMDRAGFLEVEAPILQPRELWEETGRWQKFGGQLLKLKDRKEAEYCYAPTAEEVITDFARQELRSYRHPPVTLYQIRRKFRDEIRLRFGLMLGREFLMYDGYSFDADPAGLDRSYRAQDAAYRRIFERCGLAFTVVEADSGAIGGRDSQEFMVLAETGEDAVVRCGACGYGANLEKAETGRRPGVWDGETASKLEDVETPGKGGIEDVVAFLGITADRMIKCLVYETEQGFVVAPPARRPRRQRSRVEARARRRAPGPGLRGESREGDWRARRLCRAARAPVERARHRGRVRARGCQRRDGRGPEGLACPGPRARPGRECRRLGALCEGAGRRPVPALRLSARRRARHRGGPHLQARHSMASRCTASSPTKRARPGRP